jgi:hypothetical protein
LEAQTKHQTKDKESGKFHGLQVDGAEPRGRKYQGQDFMQSTLQSLQDHPAINDFLNERGSDNHDGNQS